jgi:putative peptide zinc metalloprotease protein
MAGGEQVLADLWVPDLASRGKNVQARLEQQRWQAATAGFDIESRKRWRVAEQTAVTTSAEWHGLQAERSQFLPRAPYSGQFFLTDPDLAAGQWVGKKDALGVLVKQGTAWRVETWLDEDEVARVSVGQRASFQIDSMTGTRLSLRVAAIDRDAARILHRRELASISGGM